MNIGSRPSTSLHRCIISLSRPAQQQSVRQYCYYYNYNVNQQQRQRQQQQQQQQQGQVPRFHVQPSSILSLTRRNLLSKRYFSSSSSQSPDTPTTTNNQVSIDNNNNNNNNNNNINNIDDIPFYTAPMAGLISRLKIISITTCVISVGVLPALVTIKNGCLPTFQQCTMGGVAFLGATGSTLALDFVFGPYVLDMKWIQREENNKTTNTTTNTTNTDATDIITTTKTNLDQDTTTTTFPSQLIQATTRSVFGWKNTYIIDPLWKDTATAAAAAAIEPYAGVRPFANFSVQGVPLYVHTELLDGTTRQILLSQPPQNDSDDKVVDTSSTPNLHDREGLPLSKKKNDKDDDFW